MFHFAYDEAGQLAAERVSLETIAREVGTPTFVYTQATLERHFKVFDEAFAGHPHLVCYAMKASSNGAILKLLGSKGAGADIVSGGELYRAMKAGIPANKIVFSGVGKTPDEMAMALDAGILSFNIESEPELDVLASVAREKGLVAPVSLRVNPNVDAKTHPYIATGLRESKFGVPIDDAPRIAARVAKDEAVALVGIDCHIGSQLVTIEPLLEALEAVLAMVDRLKAEGHAIGHIDLGGGLGIPYKGEAPPHPSVFGKAVVERMKGRSEKIVLEPGRVIVGNAGLLLARVLYVKETPARRFVILDAAMNDLIRPSLYQAHHEIWPVKKTEGTFVADVVGPICESGDTFAKARELAAVEAGQLVAIMSAGAYGFTMASTYNSRPRAAEVLVHEDRYSVVRQRERIEALTDGESFPDWLDAGGEGEST